MVLVVAVVGSHSGHSSRSGIDGHGSYDGGRSRMKVAATFATILIASTKKQKSQMVARLQVYRQWGLTGCMDKGLLWLLCLLACVLPCCLTSG